MLKHNLLNNPALALELKYKLVNSVDKNNRQSYLINCDCRTGVFRSRKAKLSD
jgi:hypothetical protein